MTDERHYDSAIVTQEKSVSLFTDHITKPTNSTAYVCDCYNSNHRRKLCYWLV